MEGLSRNSPRSLMGNKETRRIFLLLYQRGRAAGGGGGGACGARVVCVQA
ncbi:hypothetical protein GDO78_022842 [Eleutherodactylus coqui]|uniref:Uncharacterized protein n=1 Tax=Eleutherodactylus coqui TaxID=57060 RepID=A0A8J6EG85_ELECQ|nr:hypothetical protein GDO78_022842 [Eleutherodactylus coqui]